MTDTYNVTVEMSRDERDQIVRLLVRVANNTGMSGGEKLDVLSLIETLMTEEK